MQAIAQQLRPCLAPRAQRPLQARRAGALRTAPRAPLPPPRAAMDFDAMLAQAAEKFEKAENKPAIVGYGVAGASALLFAEYLIHLPLFNFLLGFPIQLLGLLMLPYLGVRYGIKKADWEKDVTDAANTVIAELPGFEKK